jgi:hypothetical protein
MAEFHIIRNSDNTFNINVYYRNIVIRSYNNIDFHSVNKLLNYYRVLSEIELIKCLEAVF